MKNKYILCLIKFIVEKKEEFELEENDFLKSNEHDSESKQSKGEMNHLFGADQIK